MKNKKYHFIQHIPCDVIIANIFLCIFKVFRKKDTRGTFLIFVQEKL